MFNKELLLCAATSGSTGGVVTFYLDPDRWDDRLSEITVVSPSGETGDLSPLNLPAAFNAQIGDVFEAYADTGAIIGDFGYSGWGVILSSGSRGVEQIEIHEGSGSFRITAFPANAYLGIDKGTLKVRLG